MTETEEHSEDMKKKLIDVYQSGGREVPDFFGILCSFASYKEDLDVRDN